jgi:hypothetical protein
MNSEKLARRPIALFGAIDSTERERPSPEIPRWFQIWVLQEIPGNAARTLRKK